MHLDAIEEFAVTCDHDNFLFYTFRDTVDRCCLLLLLRLERRDQMRKDQK